VSPENYHILWEDWRLTTGLDLEITSSENVPQVIVHASWH
jgi:hypothetical protein